MKPEQEANTQQLAVWYFVAATFIFAAPAFSGDVPIWVRVASLVVGMALVVGGGIQLGREMGARKASRGGTQREEPPRGATGAGPSGTH